MGDHPATHATAPLHRPSDYMAEAELQEVYLRDKLVVIRRQFESGDITEAEAAGLRVGAYAHHLLAVTDLNHEHFGDTP